MRDRALPRAEAADFAAGTCSIEATLPNKDVGFVHKGQPVEIKVEAFTFTRYGLLHGTMTGLSQDVVAAHDTAESDASSRKASSEKGEDEWQASQPNYIAHVSLDAAGVRTENGVMPIEPGIAVAAEIKTGRRKVISYLLSPLSRFNKKG